MVGAAEPTSQRQRRLSGRQAGRRGRGGDVATLEPKAKARATKAEAKRPAKDAAARGQLAKDERSPRQVQGELKESEGPPAPPLGATMVVRDGKEEIFAGGLTGGQSAFSFQDYNFDPLGLSEKLPFMLPWFRESELKHGRIAMLGFVGLLAPEFATFPGLEGFAPKCAAAGIGGELRVVEAHDACMAEPLPLLQVSPMLLILLGAGAIEAVTTIQKIGPFGWGGWTIENAGDYPMRKEIGAAMNRLPKDERAMVVFKLQELKHCRLAMIGFSGAWIQGLLTAHGFPWLW